MRKTKTPPAPLPEPTRREREVIEEAAQQRRTRRPRLAIRIAEQKRGKPALVSPNHADKAGWETHALDTFGTSSADFVNAEATRLMNALCRTGETTPSQDRTNAALAVIDGVRPQTEVEAMLATQMAVTHGLTMELLGRTLRADQIPQFEMAGNMAVKLMRTYVAQIEVLAKLRRGGEQKVRVEHVHVHAGAQAIVGNVTHQAPPGGGGR